MPITLLLGFILFFILIINSEKILNRKKSSQNTIEKQDDNIEEPIIEDYIPGDYLPPPTEDKRVPICPNCEHSLDFIPSRKKKCPYCGKQIYTYSREVEPGRWEKHLTGEEEWSNHYAAIAEKEKEWEEKVKSGEHLREKLDEFAAMETRFWMKYKITLQWGGCDNCIGERTLSVAQAYNASPTCRVCGYGYTVTGVVDHS